jgi:hypothetical protein
MQHRSMNIVVSGISDNRDGSVWHDEGARALRIAAGKDAEIVDAFRLGRFNSSKTQPFRSAWDRRLTLAGKRKMAEAEEFRRRVYASPDDSV